MLMDFCQSAIKFFSHFIGMYHDQDSGRGTAAPTSEPRSDMDPAEAPGYLQARFMRARLNGKLQFADRLEGSSCLNFIFRLQICR